MPIQLLNTNNTGTFTLVNRSNNGGFSMLGAEPSVSPTPTPSISVTPSITVSTTPSITVTPSVTVSKTPSVSVTPAPSITPSITPTRTPSISVTPSPTPTPAPTYTIGQSALGGQIAYILQSGDPGYDANIQHGLVVANYTTEWQVQWGCYGTALTGAQGTAIGTGNQNTLDIIAGCAESNRAAINCDGLTSGGYSDWYLPSQNEMLAILANKAILGNFTNGTAYWTSTEASSPNEANFAITIVTSTSDVNTTAKYSTNKVRAVRSF